VKFLVLRSGVAPLILAVQGRIEERENATFLQSHNNVLVSKREKEHYLPFKLTTFQDSFSKTNLSVKIKIIPFFLKISSTVK